MVGISSPLYPMGCPCLPRQNWPGSLHVLSFSHMVPHDRFAFLFSSCNTMTVQLLLGGQIRSGWLETLCHRIRWVDCACRLKIGL